MVPTPHALLDYRITNFVALSADSLGRNLMQSNIAVKNHNTMDGDKESPRLTPIDKSRGYLGADNLVYGYRDAPTSLLRVDVGFWQKLSFQNFLPGTPKVSHYGGL